MSPEEPSVPPAETPREKAERLWEAEGYAAAAYVAAYAAYADAAYAAYAADGDAAYAADAAAADAAAAAYVAADGDAAYDDAFERGKARWKKEHSPPKAEGKERP